LEIIGDRSVRKDKKVLRKAYWDAGIKEYWLVDVCGERLSFDIFQHRPKGDVATRKKDGWLTSQGFGKSFRLTRQEDRLGNPRYTPRGGGGARPGESTVAGRRPRVRVDPPLPRRRRRGARAAVRALPPLPARAGRGATRPPPARQVRPVRPGAADAAGGAPR